MLVENGTCPRLFQLCLSRLFTAGQVRAAGKLNAARAPHALYGGNDTACAGLRVALIVSVPLFPVRLTNPYKKNRQRHNMKWYNKKQDLANI